MVGKLLGKIVSAPIRLINLPIQVAGKLVDFACGETNSTPIKDRDPLALEELAEATEEIGKKADAN